MTIETSGKIVPDKQKVASGISGGIFLICLGVLMLTGWWWPGILFAVGLAGGAELIFRGQVLKGIGTIAFFSAIPIFIWVIQAVNIPWGVVGALVLIGLGVITLAKLFYLNEASN